MVFVPRPTERESVAQDLFWWVQALGRSPYAPGISQKCLRPCRHSPYSKCVRHRVINPTSPKGVKPGLRPLEAEGNYPAAKTHSAKSVPQPARPAEMQLNNWKSAVLLQPPRLLRLRLAGFAIHRLTTIWKWGLSDENKTGFYQSCWRISTILWLHN